MTGQTKGLLGRSQWQKVHFDAPGDVLMTILVDEAYARTERATVAKAEDQVRERFVEVYGSQEGERRLNALFDRMAANVRSDGRLVDLDALAGDEPSS